MLAKAGSRVLLLISQGKESEAKAATEEKSVVLSSFLKTGSSLGWAGWEGRREWDTIMVVRLDDSKGLLKQIDLRVPQPPLSDTHH